MLTIFKDYKSTDNFNFPEHILTQNEFLNLIENNKTLLHNFMVKNNKYIKIFICEKETDEDRNNIGYLEDCEIDETLNDYKNRYYIAELKTLQTGYHPAIANIIWFGYHEIWSYGFDIYEMHKIDKSYKRLFIKDYYVADYNKRNGVHMANDLIKLYDIIKSLNRDIIDQTKISQLKKERILMLYQQNGLTYTSVQPE